MDGSFTGATREVGLKILTALQWLGRNLMGWRGDYYPTDQMTSWDSMNNSAHLSEPKLLSVLVNIKGIDFSEMSTPWGK